MSQFNELINCGLFKFYKIDYDIPSEINKYVCLISDIFDSFKFSKSFVSTTSCFNNIDSDDKLKAKIKLMYGVNEDFQYILGAGCNSVGFSKGDIRNYLYSLLYSYPRLTAGVFFRINGYITRYDSKSNTIDTEYYRHIGFERVVINADVYRKYMCEIISKVNNLLLRGKNGLFIINVLLPDFMSNLDLDVSERSSLLKWINLTIKETPNIQLNKDFLYALPYSELR